MRIDNFVTAASLGLILAACGPSNSQGEEVQETPLASEASPPPIESFEGKGPFDEIDGLTFWDHPLVKAAVSDAIKNPSIANNITSKSNVFLPIEAWHAMGTVGYGCEAHNCSSKNWSVLIGYQKATPERENAVCYYDRNNLEISGIYNENGKIGEANGCRKEADQNTPSSSYTYEIMKVYTSTEWNKTWREYVNKVNLQSNIDEEIEIKSIKVNKGNCEYSTPYVLPVTIRFGEVFSVRSDNDCNVIRLDVETDKGNFFYTF